MWSNGPSLKLFKGENGLKATDVKISTFFSCHKLSKSVHTHSTAANLYTVMHIFIHLRVGIVSCMFAYTPYANSYLHPIFL